MGEPQDSYAADFTSTAKGACERCGAKARKATDLKYMHHKNPKKLGHHLCLQCYDKYLNKEGTLRRTSGGTSQQSTPESRVIHQ